MNDFEVDQLDLDGEWLRQAQLYNDWASKAATALKKQNQIYLQRKIMKARLYKAAKEKFEAVGKKPTGADLEAEVRTDKEYAEISQQMIDAEEQAGLADAGKWALVEKSKALDRLCIDRDKGFFMPTGSNMKNDNLERRQEKLKEINDGLRKEMTKKKISRG